MAGFLDDFIVKPFLIVAGVSVAWGMTNLMVGAGVSFLRSTAANGPTIQLPNTGMTNGGSR